MRMLYRAAPRAYMCFLRLGWESYFPYFLHQSHTVSYRLPLPSPSSPRPSVRLVLSAYQRGGAPLQCRSPVATHSLCYVSSPYLLHSPCVSPPSSRRRRPRKRPDAMRAGLRRRGMTLGTQSSVCWQHVHVHFPLPRSSLHHGPHTLLPPLPVSRWSRSLRLSPLARSPSLSSAQQTYDARLYISDETRRARIAL